MLKENKLKRSPRITNNFHTPSIFVINVFPVFLALAETHITSFSFNFDPMKRDVELFSLKNIYQPVDYTFWKTFLLSHFIICYFIGLINLLEVFNALFRRWLISVIKILSAVVSIYYSLKKYQYSKLRRRERNLKAHAPYFHFLRLFFPHSCSCLTHCYSREGGRSRGIKSAPQILVTLAYIKFIDRPL